MGRARISPFVDDTTTANKVYIGYYKPTGTAVATSDAVWSIKVIDSTSGNDQTLWADQGNFSQIWDNRASLTYTTA